MDFGIEKFKQDLPPEAMKIAQDALMTFLKTTDLENNPAVKGMLDGLTPAQSMGLTRKDLDVFYFVGFQKLNNGDLDQAVDMFAYLTVIDPLHAPNYYCLGVALQGKGNLEAAEKAFALFCGYDATNPVGYLRLAEIYSAKGETEQAISLLEVAEAECAKGHGDSTTMEEIRAKQALVKGAMKK